MTMDNIYLQSRITAPDPDTAAEMVWEKLAKQGYLVEKLKIWPCLVQCYEKQIWFEWIARVINAEK